VKVFIGIGIETYLEHPNISEFSYAEADVREFAKVLEQHGFAASDQQLLINSEATQTRIRSVIRTTLRGLAKSDTLYLYFAGHGVGISGVNYISCYDSRQADLAGTCIEIAWLCDQFKAAACKSIVLFLDSCRSEMIGPEGMQDVYTDFAPDEIKQLLNNAAHFICFAACQTDQTSWPSNDLKHGIWTHHLIEAFDGRAETALNGGLLTDTSLQNYLQHMVPLTLRNTNPGKIQTPWKYGGASSDVQLADLTEILAARRVAKHPQSGQIKDSILLYKKSEHITKLANFERKKGHFVPDRHSNKAEDFISRLVGKEVEEELKQARDKIKTEFDYTREQCKTSWEGSSGTVTTPAFNYNITVGQDEDNCENVTWRRSIEAIIDPNAIFSDEFANVFSNTFNVVELTLHGKADLDNLVDFIERLKKTNKDIDVKYDEDEHISSCIILMKGHPPVHVTKNTFSIVHSRPAEPKVLVESLFKAQFAMTQTYQVAAIPFEAAHPKILPPSTP
jgi:hypothetical protein